MASFLAKKMNTALCLGELLTQERKKQGLDLSTVSEGTGIATKYLEHIEAGEYGALPGEVYAKSFIRTYARFLSLDPRDALARYQSESTIYAKTKKLNNPLDVKKPVERVFWHNLMVTPKIIRHLAIAGLIFVCFIYLGAKVRAIVAAPDLSIVTPTDNLVTSEKVISVTGTVEAESELKINGQPVLANQNGQFSENLVLRDGTNLIEITAQKKHSKEARVFRQVMVVPPSL